MKRLDQDINFEVGGVPCVMRLDLVSMLVNRRAGDLWVIIAHRDTDFAKEVEDIRACLMKLAYEDLTDEDGNLVPKLRRQRYEYILFTLLEVEENEGDASRPLALSVESPLWDGNSLDFVGSQRLARLLADLRDVVPEIQFTRSDGTVIEYEKFIEKGGYPYAKIM